MTFVNSCRLIILGLVLAIGACAPVSRVPQVDDELAKQEAEKQRIFAIEEQHNRLKRLDRISTPIFLANVQLCEARRDFYGVDFVTSTDVNDDYESAYRSFHNLKGKEVRIGRIVPFSPAEEVGLKAGDELLAVDGVPRKAKQAAAVWLREALFEREGKDKLMSFRVNRDGEVMDFDVTPKTICNHPVILEEKDIVNAFADGTNILISNGMFDFASEDDELALVIGHELAHNTMGHIEKQTANSMGGLLIGGILTVLTGVDMTQLGADIGASAFSQDFEAEADYVGVYYAARAGYDVSDVANFWRRMAARYPQSIHLAGSTHPSTAKRFLAIEATRDEILAKKEAGERLEPDLAAVRAAAESGGEDDDAAER